MKVKVLRRTKSTVVAKVNWTAMNKSNKANETVKVPKKVNESHKIVSKKIGTVAKGLSLTSGVVAVGAHWLHQLVFTQLEWHLALLVRH